MSVPFKTGEVKTRPFVYHRFANRSKQGSKIFSRGESEGNNVKLTMAYDEETGTVTLMASGIHISYNAAGTVTLMAPQRLVSYNAAGTVTVDGTGT